MTSQVIDWIQISLNLLSQSTNRIIWNLFLAAIPFAFSFYLFRLSAKRNVFWWFSLLIFIAFLPNAPYILTDSIHIIELSQQDYPRWAIIFILLPQYVLFIVAGFEAYIISLIRFERYLTNLVAPEYIAPSLVISNAIAHGLCVVGIYIGRFERFNSWDFATKPILVLATTIQDLCDGWKLLSMAITFLLIWLLSELVKLVNRKVSNLGN